MSIYKQALGNEFNQLHPMLQKRYETMGKQPITGRGVMAKIQGGPWYLKPFFKIGIKRKLLFSERGVSIPFSIKNTPYDHGKQIHWERAFHFEGATRYFNALMSLDLERSVIEDYLGEPPLLYSDLVFEVKRGALTIRSYKQRLVLGKWQVPLPKWFQGVATVRENFNDAKNKFEISVRVHNPLIGELFYYEGEFTCENLT